MSYKDINKKRQYALKYYREKGALVIMTLGSFCVKCGSDKDLGFDHKDPEDKTFSIGKLLSYSHERFLSKLKKCQLLCKNCHKKKTTTNKENSKNSYRKLSCSQVREIKKCLNEKLSLRKIGEKFGVSKTTIYHIKKGNREE